MSKAPTKRCAIYTRKSSDEGLDQSFNSLDAQREAGEAYAKSQAHEGWKALPAHYDDGGYSGGTMDRPGLQRLLADIKAGLVDVVVVYKIDRLTRSLADFARIVELFDARDVSFVSVTQAFNTTSSMGRLTLNVLLSFAQFEREVTGERVRDKIAASKKKGMWMGGVPPLGYDIPAPGTRKLQVNETEAYTVRDIFARYLAIGSVHQLQRELEQGDVRSKQRTTGAGKTVGGEPFSRGSLFYLLRNRIYLGQIVHKDEVYQGEHDAIVDRDIFAAVQGQLSSNARRHRAAADHRVVKAPLTGKLFDASGEPMSPTFSRGRGGRIYRYYVSASLQQGAKSDANRRIQRLPAPDIERIVSDAVQRWLPRAKDRLDQVCRVSVAETGLEIELPGEHARDVCGRTAEGEIILNSSTKFCRVLVPLSLPLRGAQSTTSVGSRSSPRPDRALVEALRKAQRMLGRDRSGMPLVTAAPSSPYDRRILGLAFLSPAIQHDIINGRQPSTLNLEKLLSTDLPLDWREQRKALDWRHP